jgi:hypothetical protein
MRPALYFPLTEVLDLADRAANTQDQASPIADEPDAAALLLVVDDGICLRGNGLPPLPPADGQEALDGARAVYAEGYPAGTPWLERVHASDSEQPFTVSLPLRDEYRLLDQLRNAAARGFTTATVHLYPGGLRVGVRRCEPAE